MGLPRQPPEGASRPGYGPFGRRGFKAGLIGCSASILGGLAMLLLGGRDVAAAGTALLVVGVVALVTVALGVLLERLVARRPPP